MSTCSITDDIVIDNPAAIEELLDMLEGKQLIQRCPYCHPPFEHFGEFYLKTGYDNDPTLYVIRKENAYGGAMIKYCPMCGRRLDNWRVENE